MAPSATPDRMSLTAAATREIFFDVEGYSATQLMADDGRVHFQSDKFTVGGYDWAVRYYPKGTRCYVSVTLVLLSELEDAGHQVGVRFACTLLDRHGERSPERWRSASRVLSSDSGNGKEWGFWAYATHDVLEDPDFIVEDCFTFVCTVSVLRKPIRSAFCCAK